MHAGTRRHAALSMFGRLSTEEKRAAPLWPLWHLATFWSCWPPHRHALNPDSPLLDDDGADEACNADVQQKLGKEFHAKRYALKGCNQWSGSMASPAAACVAGALACIDLHAAVLARLAWHKVDAHSASSDGAEARLQRLELIIREWKVKRRM